MATEPTSRFPTWADGAADVTDPGSSKQATGWEEGEAPAADHTNWLHRTRGEWLEYLYDLVSPGYQLASALDSSKSKVVTSQAPVVLGVSFAGSKMYICDDADAFQYDLGESYNPNNAIYDSPSFDLTADASDSHSCIRVNAVGTKMYTLGATNDRIYEWTLSTPYDITSASYEDFLALGSQDTAPVKFDVSQDGTKIYMFGQTNDKVFRYSMTAWDISTASFDTGQELTTLTFDTDVTGVVISGDGTQLILAGKTSTQYVGQYVLSTPYDLTSAGSLSSNTFDMTGFTTAPNDIAFSPSGRRMYIIDHDTDTIGMFYTGFIVAPESE